MGVALDGRKIMRLLFTPLALLVTGGIGFGAEILGRRGSLAGPDGPFVGVLGAPGVLTILTPCLTVDWRGVCLWCIFMSAVGVTFIWVSFIPVIILARSNVCLERPVTSSAVRVLFGAFAYCLGSNTQE